MRDNQTEIGRVTRSRKQAKATYDRISRWYDLLEGVWEKKYREDARRRLDIKAGESVLEIGFGPGHDLIAMAQSVGENGRVFGIDLSPNMLHLAQTRIRGQELAGRVDLLLGDAVQLPFVAGFLDAIFISFTLELFDTPEIPRVLGECCRVLRSGGRMDIISLSKAGGESRMRNLYEWGHQHFPSFLDCRPIYVKKAMRNAGFQIADTVQTSLMGLPLENVLGVKPN
jgi:ubiquinone/menaquinone biosynthesis C-methylase UbiE